MPTKQKRQPVQIDSDIMKQLREFSEASDGVPVTNLVRIALKQYLDHCKRGRIMTKELREVLARLEAAIQLTKPILERQGYKIADEQAQLRTPLVIAIMSQAIEHHEAMLLLIMQDITGSALALARSVVEGMYRSLWIDRVATDVEIRRFLRKDDIKIGIGTMAEAIDMAYSAGNAFRDLKRGSWDMLNSYTHNGMQQIGRRFTKAEMRPSYTDHQRATIMEVVTVCILLLVRGFLETRGFMKEGEEILNIMASYLPMWEAPMPSEATSLLS